jgi:hypothetical protein
MHAGPKVDIWVQAAGPLVLLPIAGVWLSWSVLSWHGASGDWALHVSGDALWYSEKHKWEFVHAVTITSFWVRSSKQQQARC